MQKIVKAIVISYICFLFLIFSYEIVGSETLVLTTYYPAPYGGYTRLLTTDMTLLARDGGNVGIGTSDPQAKLDIRRDRVENGYGLRVVANTPGNPTTLGYHTAIFYSPQTNRGVAIGAVGSFPFGSIQGVLANTQGPERYNDLVINWLGGNVGIGFASPPHAKLEILGREFTGGSSPNKTYRPLYVQGNGQGNANTAAFVGANGYGIGLGYSINFPQGANIDAQIFSGGIGSDYQIPLRISAKDIFLIPSKTGTGKVGIDTYNPREKLHVNGNTRIDGTLYVNRIQGFDIAEMFPAEEGVESGDVVVIDNNSNNLKVVKSRQKASFLVAGIISQTPGIVIGENIKGYKPVALKGRVLCKVNNEGGEIKKGDVLITSSKPGYAMKAKPAEIISPTQIVGVALEGMKKKEGKILVFVK